MRNYIFYFFYCQLSAFNFPKLPPAMSLSASVESSFTHAISHTFGSLARHVSSFSSKNVESVGERRKEVACKAVVDRFCDGRF